MLKLTHTTKNAALAALLAAGLAGSAAVTLTPVPVQAQTYRDRDDRYHSDWDTRYHRDWDDRYRRDWDDRGWVGVGVPGFGIGFYNYPTYYPYYSGYYNYGPYCSSYDYYYGYCS